MAARQLRIDNQLIILNHHLYQFTLHPSPNFIPFQIVVVQHTF